MSFKHSHGTCSHVVAMSSVIATSLLLHISIPHDIWHFCAAHSMMAARGGGRRISFFSLGLSPSVLTIYFSRADMIVVDIISTLDCLMSMYGCNPLGYIHPRYPTVMLFAVALSWSVELYKIIFQNKSYHILCLKYDFVLHMCGRTHA